MSCPLEMARERTRNVDTIGQEFDDGFDDDFYGDEEDRKKLDKM
jgi:hypothetical protein